MKRINYVIMAVVVLAMMSFIVSAEDQQTEVKPLAQYDTEDGLVEFMDYTIQDGTIAIIIDYTNTTEKNVSPEWQINVKLFQGGIEMDRGHSFDIEGVRDGYKEIRPETKIRVAEFFKLENNDPIEVEFSQTALFNEKEPMYVEIDLDTNKITTKEGAELGTGGKTLGGILGEAYNEVMDEYKDAYNDVMDEYNKAYDEVMDEYQDTLNDLMGQLGF